MRVLPIHSPSPSSPVVHCAIRCGPDEACTSFNINMETRSCELVVITETCDKIGSAEQFNHFIKVTIPACACYLSTKQLDAVTDLKPLTSQLNGCPWMKIVCISFHILLKYLPMCPINYKLPLVSIMTWRQTGGKSLSESMMVQFTASLCVISSLTRAFKRSHTIKVYQKMNDARWIYIWNMYLYMYMYIFLCLLDFKPHKSEAERAYRA